MRHAFLLLFLAACAPDVSKDKTAAVVSDAPATPAAPKAESPVDAANKAAADFVPVARKIDPARSTVKALGAKITKQHVITFPTVSGTITAHRNFVTGVEVTVQTADLTTEPEKLQNHLKSPDFFDVAQFPTATFTSGSVILGEGTNYTVTGQLTMHGVTKEVTFPATLEMVADAEIKGHAEFTINRKDFGIVYPGMPDDLIQDNVVLTIDLVAAVPPVGSLPG